MRAKGLARREGAEGFAVEVTYGMLSHGYTGCQALFWPVTGRPVPFETQSGKYGLGGVRVLTRPAGGPGANCSGYAPLEPAHSVVLVEEYPTTGCGGSGFSPRDSSVWHVTLRLAWHTANGRSCGRIVNSRDLLPSWLRGSDGCRQCATCASFVCGSNFSISSMTRFIFFTVRSSGPSVVMSTPASFSKSTGYFDPPAEMNFR